VTDPLLERLAASQQIVVAMLRLTAEDSYARVGAWSVRDIAGHLSATERECFEPRIRSIAASENPRFEFYTNDETDFSGLQLDVALDDWTQTRARLIDFVASLDEETRRLTGTHDKYGEITLDRYLEIALEHDLDHLRALEGLADRLAR
jgi:hypothetical protein